MSLFRERDPEAVILAPQSWTKLTIPRIARLSVTASFVALTAGMMIASAEPPAAGYELSIYDSLSPWFWALLTGSVAGFLASAFLLVWVGNRAWVLGLLGLLMAYATFLLLPVLRGYFLGFPDGGDALTHIGETKVILATGEIGGNNFYPILHLLIVGLAFTTGIQTELIANSLPVLFYLLYVASIWLVATSFAKSSSQGIKAGAIVLACTPMLFSIFSRQIHPSFLSLYGVPLLLYAWHTRTRIPESLVAYTVVILIGGFFITFAHPGTALMVIIAFAILSIAWPRFQPRQEPHGKFKPKAVRRSGGSFSFVVLLSTVFLSWYLSYWTIVRSVRRLLMWLAYQDTPSILERQTQLLSLADLTLPQAFWLFVNQYGGIATFLLISFCVSIYVLRRGLARTELYMPGLGLLVLLFLTTFVVAIALLFTDYLEAEIMRNLRLPLVFSAILNGLTLSSLLIRQRGRAFWRTATKVVAIILVVLVVLSSIIGIFNVYGSQRILRGNDQVTYAEVTGIRWHLLHSGSGIDTMSNVRISKFEDLLGCGLSTTCPRIPVAPGPVPSHFGYDRVSTVTALFPLGHGYLVTTHFDRVSIFAFPPDLREKKGLLYNEDDFGRLQVDLGVSHVYSNGDVEVWFASRK